MQYGRCCCLAQRFRRRLPMVTAHNFSITVGRIVSEQIARQVSSFRKPVSYIIYNYLIVFKMDWKYKNRLLGSMAKQYLIESSVGAAQTSAPMAVCGAQYSHFWNVAGPYRSSMANGHFYAFSACRSQPRLFSLS